MSSDRAATAPASGSDHASSECGRQPRRISDEHARRVCQCFKENHAQLIHWLVTRTGSWAIARDIADQAFSNVLEMEHPESVGDVRPYVYKTAFNLAARRAETAAIHRRIYQVIGYEPDRISPSPEPVCVDQQRLETLQQAIEALPPRVRMALKLRFWDERPYAEITLRFREKGVVVSLRTIKRWVANGLECCRQEIELREGKGEQ
jgi:RNA polymerase sigma factor (sigma-70 family)